MASARMTVDEMLATTPYIDEDERARPLPLTDTELADAIVRLVRLYPGRLGRPRITHILAGHRGRKIKAKYSHLPDYGRDPFVSREQVRHRVARLLQTGRLEQRGGNPPRLVPAAEPSRSGDRRASESGAALERAPFGL